MTQSCGSIGVTEYRCGGAHTDTPALRHSDTALRRRGFSLTEILIVIGLIVLMLALAVPTFNFMTGNRSVEGAQNTVAALIGRARAEAIGLQETRGVFFFIDRASGRVAAALVRGVEGPVVAPAAGATFQRASTVAATEPLPEAWLDLVPDTEFVTLPPGVMLQTIDDAMVSGGARIEDGYIGYNRRNEGNALNAGAPTSDTHTLYGGAILFDGSGQLVARRYAFKTFFFDGSMPPRRQPTRIGDLLYRPKGDPNPLNTHYEAGQINDVVPRAQFPSSVLVGTYYPKSQLGVVLFDRERWHTVAGGRNPPYDAEWDWQFESGVSAYGSAGSAPDEYDEESWIDENGLPLLVNRYNGTLVRAQ